MTDLVSTHLLQRVDILDGQVIALQLGSQTREGILEVDLGPFTNIPRPAVRFRLDVGIRTPGEMSNMEQYGQISNTRLVWRQRVVEL